MKVLTSLQPKRVGSFWSAKANGVQLPTFDSLSGERGLTEYIRTHYTRADGSQLTLADIRATL